MAKRITESMRIAEALEMIEAASSDAQSTNPKYTWKQSHDAICAIYKVAHAIRAPQCRKNHPEWCGAIDDAIRKGQSGKPLTGR